MSEEELEVQVEEHEEDQEAVEKQQQLEKQARQFGWVPKEEFRGSEDTWVDAATFVQRGKEINPILRKNNERLMKELESTRKQMDSLREATEEFKKFQREAYERKAQDLEAEIQALRQQKKEAIRNGDGDLAVDIEERIDDLKDRKHTEFQKSQEPEKKPEPQQQELPPEVEEWVARNSWYSQDQAMRMATDAVATALHNAQPFLKGAEFFKALDKELAKTFAPEKLGRTSKPRSPIESSTTSTSSTARNRKSYESLPADAKAACDRFVKQGLMTREEYVASFDW